MSKNSEPQSPRAGEFRSTVVSEPGAIIRVERIEISERTRKALTTGVKSIGSPRDSDKHRGTR